MLAAAALPAMLVFAPAGSAAPHLVASGTTTLAISHGFEKKARRAGIKITAIKPTRLRGAKVTLKVDGGEITPARGAGTISHGGGLRLRRGRRSVALRRFAVDTRSKAMTVRLGAKKVRLAKLTGLKVARAGFGDRIVVRKLRLTGAGARALDERLTPTRIRSRGGTWGRAAVKALNVKRPFKANLALGRSTIEVEPETVTVLPIGAMTFDADPTLLGKLAAVATSVEAIPPTTYGGTAFGAPIGGGTISPLGSMGQVASGGGLSLTQNLPNGSQTTIRLGAMGVDLAAKTASAAVSAESNFVEPGSNPPREPLDLGELPRTSIADLRIAGIAASPATRAVTVAASATLQKLAAEVLEGLVKAYQSYYEQTLTAESGRSPAEVKMAAEARVAADHIKAGEPLGSLSFTASAE